MSGENTKPERASGAELLRRALVHAGVRVMFGHPGGAILPFYDVLHGAPAPRHILMRHEQGAAHAADGYARASGEVGVCVATSGPGAANLVTGLATSLCDGVPIVAITGQVPSTLMGTDAFQECDTLGITMPVTKHGFLVRRPEDIAGVVQQAFEIARSGRPGPVLVDIPKDVQFAEADVPTHLLGLGPNAKGPTPVAHRGSADAGEIDYAASWVDGKPTTAGAAIAAALARLRAAERPVLIVGRGVISSGTTEEIHELAEATNLPVVTTLLGLDAFPTLHPQCVGMPGMHGTQRANQAISAADLIIGLGLRFDDRVTGKVSKFAPGAGIIHFDIDPRAHGRTIRTDVAVLGDLKHTVPPFVRGAREGYRVPAEWWQRMHEWRREAAEPAVPMDAAMAKLPPSGRQVSRAIANVVRREHAIVVTDVGQHQMWLAQEVADADPGTHLTSGGLGTMGYALPAALGAAVGAPNRNVWAVIGDGGFQMTLQELATVVQEGLHLRICIMNNGALGMVRQWQMRIHGGRRVASDLGAPDFAALANAYRIHAEMIETAGELDMALDRAATWPGPVVLDLRIPAEDEVYPMVPSGAGLAEMWMRPPGEKVTT
jgi:acetolactate synthase-1/2/3 large subunit